MNNRPVTEDDLQAFIDQQLTSARHAEVESYLDAHPEVATRVSAMATQRDMLRKILLPIAEEPVPPELNLNHIIEAQRRSPRSRWWTVAAACALIAISGSSGWMLRGLSDTPTQGVASIAQEAADNYAVYGLDRTRPVELRAANTNELISWASARLGRPVVVPNLEASGYRFMGGRIVATPHGPAALFMYGNGDGLRLVMLTRPMALDRTTSMELVSKAGVNGYAWATRGMGYSLVGPTDPQSLHPIADEVRRQLASEI